MNFLIVTGLSGAGKSMAVNALEDIGFFCIDNIPAGLLPRILDFAQQGENQLSRVAVVMDIRGLHSVQETNEALEALDEKKMPYDILFLDASDAAIRRRYKETRRVHPMTISEGIPVSEAITKERQILQPLRERAKYVIDTSLLSTAQNRERVSSLFLQKGQCAMSINVVSFGFKYGLPQEADIVFDVRCLPNPFYVPELKEKTGLDQEVVDYVMKFPESQELLRRIESFLEYALPLEVILDFSGVTFMDSSGIAVALHTLQQVRRLGGKMWIANPSQQAKKVFFAAGIQRMIKMEDAYEK